MSSRLLKVPVIVLVILVTGVAVFYFTKGNQVAQAPSPVGDNQTNQMSNGQQRGLSGTSGADNADTSDGSQPSGTQPPSSANNPLAQPTLNFTGEVLASGQSPVLNFVKSDYDLAKASEKLMVLYFYANWCPICRAEVPKFYSALTDLDHDEVVGFRVNYNDNETDDFERDLAREFGIAYQHTKVFLKSGERVLKSPETWEKDRYIAEINKFLE